MNIVRALLGVTDSNLKSACESVAAMKDDTLCSAAYSGLKTFCN